MIDRLRQEDGFTLPELLVTLIIGLAVSLATLTLIDVAMRRSGEVSARIEAVQAGRAAMDTMTRELRSSVCIPRTGNTADLRVAVEAAKADSITFFTDLRDTSYIKNPATPTPTVTALSGPDKRKLEFTADGNLIESIYKVSGGNAATYYSYPAEPTSQRVLLTSAEHAQQTVNGTTTDIPYFQYFRYDFKQSAAAGRPAVPEWSVATGDLTSAQITTVAKIRITYKANPAKKRADGRASTVFTNEVFTRNVDPNAENDELSQPCK